MFIRTVTAKGEEYVQLVHNYREPEEGKVRAKVRYSFGRKDKPDLDELRRLIRSISRYLDREEAAQIQEQIGGDWPFEFLGSRELGGTAFLDGMWKRLGVDRAIKALLKERAFQTPIERLLFAMTAHRALAPASKLHMELDEELRKRGAESKGRRPDLSQVVVAFAVTRDGIPVRCWVWPGNTVGQNVIEKVKRGLNSWRLVRVVLVEDTGFNVALNPAEAERDRKKRDDIVAETVRRLDALKQLDGEPHEKAACALRSHPVFGRYIQQTKTGKLRLNREKIEAEERLDGKFLISTSDDDLPARDMVLGYKQLAAVERVFRDLKHVVDIRPIRHCLPERILAHVLLCWLAMLLMRVAENEGGQTWFQIKKALDKSQVGIHRTRAGEAWQASNPSDELKELFEGLKLKIPPRILSLPTPRGDRV